MLALPVFFGSTPTTIGASLPELNDDLPVVAVPPVVKLSGAPDLQLRIPESCQFSTSRCTIEGALDNSARFGPKGSENVPLPVIWCVRSRPSGPRFKLLFRSVLKTVPPSSSEIPRDLLHVYAICPAKPFDIRLFNSSCIEW